MANIKISNLPVAANANSADTLPVVQSAVTKQVAVSTLFTSSALTGTPTAPTAATGTNTTQIATTAFVEATKTAIFNALHPVGSIYINATNATNPGTLLGFGTWTAFGAGRVPVGFDAGNALFDTAEETGGSADAIAVSHTHTFSATTSTAGAHTHGPSTGGSFIITGAGAATGFDAGNNYFPTTSTSSTTSAGSHSHTVSDTTDSTGSSGTNANYPPYITVYMWKRTA